MYIIGLNKKTVNDKKKQIKLYCTHANTTKMLSVIAVLEMGCTL